MSRPLLSGLRCAAALTVAMLASPPASHAAASGATPSALPAPVVLTTSSDWFMQDIAQVKDGGEAVSKVGYAFQVYAPVPYNAPPTASANPPTATRIPDEVRNPRGGGGRGAPAAPAAGAPAARGAGASLAPTADVAAIAGLLIPARNANVFAQAAPAAAAPAQPAAPAAGRRGGARGGGRGNPGINDTDPKQAAIAGAQGTWPINSEANRPSFSSDWVQAPRPSSPAWYKATMPGTVLTTLVDNKIYPEPLYGDNNRPNIIPETLSQTSYWYRTEFTVPTAYAGKRVWLNFDGINYIATVWVNGVKAGEIKGAFIRGNFDITALVTSGQKAAVAVLIQPPLHPGDPWEKTVANERGPNGGGTSGQLGRDGPTFVAAIGWDWVPGIRDRQSGIWQQVTLTATGPVLVKNPHVVTDLPLPSTASADITIEVTLQNTSDATQTGVFSGKFGDIVFQSPPATVPAKGTLAVKLTPATNPALHLNNPRLWWPNGFGEPNLYPVTMTFAIGGAVSDQTALNVGIRELAYTLPTMPNPDNLVVIVNGVPVMAKGGNWGMDEALKRIPRDALEARIKLHKYANYTIIRNWVGQSTSEDFFDLCDRYGIMVWDEFFQANPNNGRDPDDPAHYLTNIRDTVLRYRNHPSIVIWGGRNEGGPTPAAIADGNIQILSELDPTRFYQASSTAGRGVASGGGGYGWRPPQSFYGGNFAFNTEVGAGSIPNLESIQSWMDPKDWMDVNFPNDVWAEHDLTTGAGNPAGANQFQTMITTRYGPYKNLPEFVRKAQMADYEAWRAMYENRHAKLFNPSTAVIAWMSNPAQPCFVWQIYDYSLEPFATFFGVQKANEPVHIMMTQDAANNLVVVNHTAKPLTGYKARVRVVALDGSVLLDETRPAFNVANSAVNILGPVTRPAAGAVHFVKVELLDAAGKIVSDNFYWRETVANDLTAMDTMPDVTLDAKIVRRESAGEIFLDVTLTNPGRVPAVMAHVQLRQQGTNARVLPVNYTDNYVSLLPGETRPLTVVAALKDLKGDQPLVVVDGWNVTAKPQSFTTGGPSAIAPNTNAIVVRPSAKVATN